MVRVGMHFEAARCHRAHCSSTGVIRTMMIELHRAYYSQLCLFVITVLARIMLCEHPETLPTFELRFKVFVSFIRRFCMDAIQPPLHRR